jgi:hypothetical protein
LATTSTSSTSQKVRANVDIRTTEIPPRDEGPALPRVASFLKSFWVRVVAISAALTIPCFWHRRIVASDLGSHLYNVWLAQLVDHGQVTGLWVSHQWTNILFDVMLGAVGTVFSLHTAERVVVPIAVLIFFWGAFAMVSAATKRAPWFIAPFLALAAYGWTFHIGLFNYYLSLGLSFFGIAIFWRGKGREKLLALALVPLILLANPLGLLWLFAACVYIGIAERVPVPLQALLFLAAVAIIYGMRYYILHHFGIQDSLGSIAKYNGADQVVLFGLRYNLLKTAVIYATIAMVAIDAIRRVVARQSWALFLIPLQLYLIIEFGVQMLPSGVTISPELAAVAILTERLTSVAAVLACCVLGAMRPSKWHLAATAAIASVFFVYLYQDTGLINNIEAQAARLVRTLPRNSHVMATIFPLPGSRIYIVHMIDRACIDYCFDYGNYEPGTGLFRVRGDERGPYNVGDYGLAVDMEQGHYKVLPQDLPLYQVYQCTASGTVLCITPLHAGEENDSMGVYGHPKPLAPAKPAGRSL